MTPADAAGADEGAHDGPGGAGGADRGGIDADGTLHRALGLTDDEAGLIAGVLGRAPNGLELAMYAVMWSEHCSYKSSRLHLKRLPSEGERVLVGPGENAGVIDAGDGIAVAVRIESHNHPSAVEPYQGAATGVGGILRDVFTMGARPICLMDPLFFGPLDDARNRFLFEGVVAGISGYGNAVGVPTVGGELTFAPCYARNPLVNVFCLGVMPKERLVLGRASGEGNLAVLLGSSTGRDGIGGVSVLASAGFGGEADASKRPSVQVGDPFEEKRLIEACLELLDRGLVVGIQDLGGAGLACATSETAARAGMGMDVFVSEVPRREPGMEPFEVMTSESQERMLAIVEPSNEAAVLEVCARWEVRASVVGVVTAPVGAGGGDLRVYGGRGGELLAAIPAGSLADDAPLYDRPLSPPPDLAVRRAAEPVVDGPAAGAAGAEADLLGMLAGQGDASWVWRQYDHQLFLNTVVGPGRDAALLRLSAPGLPASERGLAVSCDSNPGWCAVDPRVGTAWLVAESAVNVALSGARPVALVNCLNFGNPEHPEVMWQLSEAVDGMGEACRALGIPVVGGNVSLYNESAGADIDPTPVVAVLGLVERLRSAPPWAASPPAPGAGPVEAAVVLLGEPATALAGSRWAVERRGLRGGTMPAPDYPALGALVGLLADLVGEVCAAARGEVPGAFAGEGSDAGTAGTGGAARVVGAAGAADGAWILDVHDVSDGGLAVALAELAMWSGVGFEVGCPAGAAALWSEVPGRAVVVTSSAQALSARAAAAGVRATVIGVRKGDRLVVSEATGDGPVAGGGVLLDVPVSRLRAAWEGALPDALGEGLEAVPR